MYTNEQELNLGLKLPSLIYTKPGSYFTYHQKDDKDIKYRITSDLKNNFLTRYNKKFWESSTLETQKLSYNHLKKNKQKFEDKCKSQTLPKTVNLNLIEENQFDDMMKNELENIDRWIFNNLKKMPLPISVKKNDTVDKKLSINMDIKMLNFIVQTSRKTLNAPTISSRNRKSNNGSLIKESQNKVAITNETLNNEYNKAILIELIQKKLMNKEYLNNKDYNHNIILAKMVASDLIASFKTLNVFKHQNIIKYKDVLESLSKKMESATESLLNSEKSDSGDDYLYYEKALKKNLKECEDEITSLKLESKNILNLMRQKKTNINNEKQKLYELNKILEEKENETGRNRKIGEKMKLREFMEINEYKSKKIKLESNVNQYAISVAKEIKDLNKKSEILDKDIGECKFKKTWFTFKLKEFYIDFLLNENELIKINKSLVSMIKNIWSLDEEVFISNFSKFYDKEDVIFILKYTKIHNEFIKARAQNNSRKKEIKNTLKKNFDDIINEDEYKLISDVKDDLKKFKSTGLKLYERKKIKTSKRSFVYKYYEVTREHATCEHNNLIKSKTQNFEETNGYSSKLSQLSENLSQLKEKHIKNILKRTIEKNNRNKLLDLSSSEYLKKMLRLLFGYKEMQIILQKLLKDNHVQIIPI